MLIRSNLHVTEERMAKNFPKQQSLTYKFSKMESWNQSKDKQNNTEVHQNQTASDEQQKGKS